ncbi:MAG: hypothetical protein HC898_03295 [Phycisphaerales bacterium]|nr:hypothetical protein [Phycisphaerales bacterium]
MPMSNGADVPDDLDKGVKVGSFGQIDLHVKDQDLTKILQLLSIQSQRNIIVNKGVTGTVTADLYSVDFYQALDALLHANGLGYLEKGNFIYVYTQDDLKRIKEAERKTVMRLYRLNYLTAADANTFASPLLSPAGKIQFSTAATPGFQTSMSDGGANSYAFTDTVVITDYEENQEEIANLIKQLDVRPKQVLIEASVLSAKLEEDNAFGVNLSILADFPFGNYGAGVGQIFGAGGSTPTFGTVGGSGTGVEWSNIIAKDTSFRVGILSENIAAFIEALDKVIDTTILANPKLLVLNRQKASILIGGKDGYISTTQSETTTTQTVEFLEFGNQLSIRPFISEDEMVRMEIQPKISEGEVVTKGTFIVPEETTQELTTNVIVRSGQTVILGGLFKERTTVTRKQVPVVGDIPILGNAFKGTSDGTVREEYIFLITPTVMKDQAIYAAGDRMKDNVELARTGAREGLLPWARTKLTNSHMKNALDAMENGDQDKALHSANMALSLDPTYVEARRLVETINQERVLSPYDSVLEDTIRDLIREKAGDETMDGKTMGAAPVTSDAAVSEAAATDAQVSDTAVSDAAANTDMATDTEPAAQSMTEAQAPLELP